MTAPDPIEVDDLFDETGDGALVLRVRAQPGARTSGVVGRHGSALKVRVSAPPDRGKANDALVVALASALGVAPRQITLVAGATNRSKRFRVEGCTPDDLRAALARLLDDRG